MLVGFNDDVSPAIWVEREYSFNSRKEGYQKTNSHYARDLQRFVGDYPVKKCFIDPSAASMKVELKQAMPKLLLADANNDVLSGIGTVSKMLANGDLKVVKSCKNLIAEMHSYVWDMTKAKRGLDEPKKEFDHAIDCLRYICHTHWGHKKSIKEKSQEERDLEMMKKMSARDRIAQPWGHGWRPL